jgi:hypothetical protein
MAGLRRRHLDFTHDRIVIEDGKTHGSVREVHPCPCARHRAARLKRQEKVRSSGFEAVKEASRPRLTVVATRETSTENLGKIIKYG